MILFICRKTVLLFVFTLSAINTHAQKEIANQQNGWYMYFGNHKLNAKLGLHTEFQLRRADWVNAKQQVLWRFGLDYKLKDQVMVSGGYAYIDTWPYGDQPVNRKFAEHRIWQQLILTQRSQRFYFNHRYRLEQRWMEGNGGTPSEGFTYRNRARYRLMITVPLTAKEMAPGVIFFNTYDEVMLQFGKNFQRNYFDQNRLYAALGYQFSSKGNVQLGYLNQYLVKGDGLKAERNHTFQVSVFYNMDWSKKSHTQSN